MRTHTLYRNRNRKSPENYANLAASITFDPGRWRTRTGEFTSMRWASTHSVRPLCDAKRLMQLIFIAIRFVPRNRDSFSRNNHEPNRSKLATNTSQDYHIRILDVDKYQASKSLQVSGLFRLPEFVHQFATYLEVGTLCCSPTTTLVTYTGSYSLGPSVRRFWKHHTSKLEAVYLLVMAIYTDCPQLYPIPFPTAGKLQCVCEQHPVAPRLGRQVCGSHRQSGD